MIQQKKKTIRLYPIDNFKECIDVVVDEKYNYGKKIIANFTGYANKGRSGVIGKIRIRKQHSYDTVVHEIVHASMQFAFKYCDLSCRGEFKTEEEQSRYAEEVVAHTAGRMFQSWIDQNYGR